jgi:hypothetical protein
MASTNATSCLCSFGGVLPPVRVLLARGNYRCYLAVSKFGGRKHIESCLYPGLATILPYYLAILIHTAGTATLLLRRETAELREQLGKLAALVDHYYAFDGSSPLAEHAEGRAVARRTRLDCTSCATAR